MGLLRANCGLHNYRIIYLKRVSRRTREKDFVKSSHFWGREER